jgi:hypothetical protein
VGLSAQQVPDHRWVAAQLGQHANRRVVSIQQAKQQVLSPDVPVATPHSFEWRRLHCLSGILSEPGKIGPLLVRSEMARGWLKSLFADAPAGSLEADSERSERLGRRLAIDGYQGEQQVPGPNVVIMEHPRLGNRAVDGFPVSVGQPLADENPVAPESSGPPACSGPRVARSDHHQYWTTNTGPPILDHQYWTTNTGPPILDHQYWTTNTGPPILD